MWHDPYSLSILPLHGIYRALQEQKEEQAAEELAQVAERIGPHFRRAEVRQRVTRFLEALLSAVERDEEAVRDELRGYVGE